MTPVGWVWPPVLIGLVVWMFVQARKPLLRRTRIWLLYPVLAFRLAASGGVYGVYGAILIKVESDVAVASQAILDPVELVRIGTPLADS